LATLTGSSSGNSKHGQYPRGPQITLPKQQTTVALTRVPEVLLRACLRPSLNRYRFVCQSKPEILADEVFVTWVQAGFAHSQPGMRRLPQVARGLAYPHLAANVCHPLACRHLPQYPILFCSGCLFLGIAFFCVPGPLPWLTSTFVCHSF